MANEGQGKEINIEAEAMVLVRKVVEIAQNYSSLGYSNFSLTEEMDNIPITPDVFAAVFPRTLDSNAILQFSLTRKVDPREYLQKILALTLPERTRSLEGEHFRKADEPLVDELVVETIRLSCNLQKLPIAFIMFSDAKTGDKKTMHLYLYRGITPSQGLSLIQQEAQRRLTELG